jgi:hypothetical protein
VLLKKRNSIVSGLVKFKEDFRILCLFTSPIFFGAISYNLSGGMRPAINLIKGKFCLENINTNIFPI